ncbi:MAG: hypothetical protein V3T70_00625, partial [Phycisphaerae bacterium]
GLIGCAALVVAAVWAFIARRQAGAALRQAQRPPATAPARGIVGASAVAIALVLVLFLRLPLEAGYLVPAVPFVLLLLARLLDRRGFRVVCALLCISPFVCSVGRAEHADQWAGRAAIHLPLGGQKWVIDPLTGPIVRAHRERLYGLRFVDAVLEASRALPDRSVVIAGYWLPQIRVRTHAEPLANVEFVYVSDAESLARYSAANRLAVCVPGMDVFNTDANGFNPADAGIQPLVISMK